MEWTALSVASLVFMIGLAGSLLPVVPGSLIVWLVGPIIGAVIGELAAGRTFRDGGKAGVGTVVGGIVAFTLKFGISVCVIALFFFDLFLF
jgi:uncharacterized protein YqgC (DUF456 family)